MPHLVVVIEFAAGTKSSYANYHIIQIAPISAETEYASDGDLLIEEEESPLGYSFMIELWNEQPMLQENLDCCLAGLILDTKRYWRNSNEIENNYSVRAKSHLH